MFARFRLRLIFFRYRNHMQRNAIKIRMKPGIRMIADDQRKIASQFPVSLAVKQVHQTMVKLRNKDRHSWTVTAHGNSPVHSKFVSDRPERARKILQIQSESIEIPFDACQVKTFFASLMLLKMQNVPVV